MQIKTTMRCCLTSSILAKIEKIPSADKDEEKKGSHVLLDGGGNATLGKKALKLN